MDGLAFRATTTMRGAGRAGTSRGTASRNSRREDIAERARGSRLGLSLSRRDGFNPLARAAVSADDDVTSQLAVPDRRYGFGVTPD